MGNCVSDRRQQIDCNHSSAVRNVYECSICSNFYTEKQRIKLSNCGHSIHDRCLLDYIKSKITQVFFDKIVCLQCPGNGPFIDLSDISNLISRQKSEARRFQYLTLSKFEQDYAGEQLLCRCYSKRRCEYICFVKRDSQFFRCEICGIATCIQCRSQMHFGVTCQEFKQNRVFDINFIHQNYDKKLQELALRKRKIVKCIKCKVPGKKQSGCPHLTCQLCKTEFCEICGQSYPCKRKSNQHQAMRKQLDQEFQMQQREILQQKQRRISTCNNSYRPRAYSVVSQDQSFI